MVQTPLVFIPPQSTRTRDGVTVCHRATLCKSHSRYGTFSSSKLCLCREQSSIFTDASQQSPFSFLEVCKTSLASTLFHLSKVHTGHQGELRLSRAGRSPQQQPQVRPNGAGGERSPERLCSEWSDGRRDFQGRSQRETSDVSGICTAAKMTAMICWQPYTSSQDLASQESCGRVYSAPWTHPIWGTSL